MEFLVFSKTISASTFCKLLLVLRLSDTDFSILPFALALLTSWESYVSALLATCRRRRNSVAFSVGSKVIFLNFLPKWNSNIFTSQKYQKKECLALAFANTSRFSNWRTRMQRHSLWYEIKTQVIDNSYTRSSQHLSWASSLAILTCFEVTYLESMNSEDPHMNRSVLSCMYESLCHDFQDPE